MILVVFTAFGLSNVVVFMGAGGSMISISGPRLVSGVLGCVPVGPR